MDSIIHHEIELGLASFLLGVAMMASYDLLRILRRVVRHNVLAVSLQDFLYWSAAIVVIFEFLRVQNRGIFRYSIILMAAAGMLAYYLVLGRYAVPFLAKYFIRFKKWMIKKAKKYKTILTEPIKKAIMRVYRHSKDRLRRRKKKRESKGSNIQGEKK